MNWDNKFIQCKSSIITYNVRSLHYAIIRINQRWLGRQKKLKFIIKEKNLRNT